MKLNFSLGTTQPLHRTLTPLMVVPVTETALASPFMDSLPESFREAVKLALKDKDFKPSAGYCLLLRHLPDMACPRILLVGAGGGSQADLQKCAKAWITQIKKSEQRKGVVYLAGLQGVEQGLLEQMLLAADHSAYEYSYTLSTLEAQRKEDGKVNSVALVLTGLAKEVLKPCVARVQALADGVRLAREWGNRPANYATPTQLAQVAKTLAREHQPISVQVFDKKEIEKLKMGAFLAVAKGSHEAMKFITLKYQGAQASSAPVVLVGKGITFDSGGISLKPAVGMDEMKFDMCGAASVLGVFEVLAKLKPSINVVGLIASCENLPGGNAVKPGDVVTSMSGKTIEILNTDAEGRLVLCDALTYAQRFKPRAIIDVATLTGACVVALGKVRSGLFSNDKSLQAQLQEAGERSGDLCWALPLDAAYAQALKTRFADIANVGGRDAGAITAASFLQSFVGDFPWAHLDIAATAWNSGKDKGATGRPVALLVNYLLNNVSKPTKRSAK